MLKIRVEIGPHNHTWNLTFEISSFTTYVRYGFPIDN